MFADLWVLDLLTLRRWFPELRFLPNPHHAHLARTSLPSDLGVVTAHVPVDPCWRLTLFTHVHNRIWTKRVCVCGFSPSNVP